MYADMDLLSSVSDFQISPERRYALENGLKCFVNVDGKEDWEWLVNIKVNYFKFFYCLESFVDHLNSILFRIFQEYKLRIPDDFFWHLFQLYMFVDIAASVFPNKHMASMYLRYFANKQLSSVHNATPSKMAARKMLNQTNMIWFEEITNETDSSFKIISHTFLENHSSLQCLLCGRVENVS